MHAVIVGSDADVLETLRVGLAAGDIEVRDTMLPHRFFGRLAEFAACPVVVQWPLRGDIPGEAVLRRIRELFRGAAPIVAIGFHCGAEDAVGAMKAGADDFVCAEAATGTMAARLRETIERHQATQARSSQCVRFGDYEIEYATQTVTLRGRRIALTPKELDLFWVFVTNFERLLPKAELMACVWGRDSGIDTHTVSQHVYTLRNKLSLDRNGLQLAAVYGAGYRLQGRRDALPGERPAGAA